MKVQVYGHSDDLIEIDGGISNEFAHNGGTERLHVLSDGVLQFVIDVEYAGWWNVTPKFHDNWDETPIKASDWKIKLEMGNPQYCDYSMVLNINTKGDNIEIVKVST